MRTYCLLFVLIIISLKSAGQVTYEKGYFIDNNNQKSDCLIKNSDWNDNPVEFEFRMDENADPQKGFISGVKEFAIPGKSKYISVIVKIDRSSDNPNKLEYGADPLWAEEKVFLKVLIEGKASLYSFQDRNRKRYFYSVGDSAIRQLIYKEYLAEQKSAKNNYAMTTFTATNMRFRSQLLSDVNCRNTGFQNVNNLDYRKNELEKYFIGFNECEGNAYTSYKQQEKKKTVVLKITPGVNYSSISISNPLYNSSSEGFRLKSEFNIRLGLDAEFLLPFNMNKWGIVLEPTFISSDTEKIFTTSSPSGTWDVSVKSRSVDFPAGIRYHMFLNENTAVFINAFYITNYSLNFKSAVKINSSASLNISDKSSFAAGGGIEYKKISGEIRYYTDRGILNGYSMWDSAYKSISFIIGYKLF